MHDSADGAMNVGYSAKYRLSGVTWNSRSTSPRPRFLLRRRAISAHRFRARQAKTPRPYWFYGKFALSSMRAHSQDGRIAAYTLGVKQYNLGFDAASRIGFIAENGNAANTNNYGYDALDRLTQATLPNSSFGYGYDAVGNRRTKTAGANTDLYAYGAASNRVASITPASGPLRTFQFDANGSTTNDGVNQYAYDTRGRLIQATTGQGAASYQVNALGQRVQKSAPGLSGPVATVFHYDSRGRLIAESDPQGVTKREYLYLDDLPVGVLQ